jgi:hypothetical protein
LHFFCVSCFAWDFVMTTIVELLFCFIFFHLCCL